MRADDRALEVVLANADFTKETTTRTRDRLGRLVDGLVARAVAAGAVREDFAGADVYAFLYMIGAVADRTNDVAPDAWRRYAEALMVGFGLDPSPAPLPTARDPLGSTRGSPGEPLRTSATYPVQCPR
ncbi:hypothetical protein SAMN05216489_07457 [Streptomyces sp. 3213]|uniref:SbtR family transcriptional regulator n=1 Tax=Streptomyces sp. 3213.3 TaxID=1855348 RepID=UPI00089A4C8E|nr:hypothetical protein SAMN05216489_07457 [Streptomyces sp. 3213] [Streptomyces sp. 3213.3]